MTKVIVGSYLSQEEAVNAVNIYELEGHEAKNIIILAPHESRESLDHHTDVAVTDNRPNEHQPGTLMDKLKEKITHNVDFKLDTQERLVDYGLSNEDAAQCLTDMQAGKIVVVADDELRMGHQ